MPHDSKKLQQEIAGERTAAFPSVERTQHILNSEMTDVSPLPDLPAGACPDCGGEGWWAKYPANGDPPEQIQCEKCYGTGTLDLKAHGAT